jgi:uncharacterized protein YuzE
MKIKYDAEADAMYIMFQEGEYEVSKEVADGILVDYSKDGKILGIEIVNALRYIPRKEMEEIVVSTPIKERA